VPKPYHCGKNSYSMDKIDDSYSYESKESAKDKEMIKELKTFYQKMMKNNYFPLDYELFKQKDGKVALIDFDKFIPMDKSFKVKDYLLQGAYVPQDFKL
jgi:RIO-like serine/threonine protein kinase